MGMTSRRKGYRGEKEIRDIISERLLTCVWQAEDPKKPDIRVENLDGEVKYRASVPQCIYKWLDEKHADFLAVRRISKTDRGKRWLAVCDMNLFLDLLEDRFVHPEQGVDEEELYG
jgi:hypothetical protein